MQINKLVVFDIETAGLYRTYEDLRNDNPKMADLWDKRADYLRNQFKQNQDLTTAELWSQKSGLHAEFSKIVAVSFGIKNKKTDDLKIQSNCDADERFLLESCAHLLNNTGKLGMTLAGHTIKRFDIPFLWKRFLINKIQPPSIINTWNKKPWEVDFFDVTDFWSNGVWQESHVSLDLMATVLGFESPKDSVQGSGVHQLFWDNKLEEIKAYCDGDVRTTFNIIDTLLNVI